MVKTNGGTVLEKVYALFRNRSLAANALCTKSRVSRCQLFRSDVFVKKLLRLGGTLVDNCNLDV